MTITSFGVVNEPSQFAMAYYRDSGTDALTPPLYVLRYDKGTRQWYRRKFNEGEVKATFTAGLPPGQKPLMVDCLGSESMSAAAGSLLLSTHLSPSAECTMVLGSDLRLVSAFSGWKVAALGSEIVVERSEIHFAPTHPLRLALVHLATGRERDLFPPVNDRLREQFRQRLAALRNEDWCREQNASCDPQEMSTELDNIAVNADADAVAHRIADPVILRMIGKWLNAGAMQDGVVTYAEEGTPQGGSISPVLSNLYLHFVLDLWFEKKVKPRCRGEAHLVRFADDFVVSFQYRQDVDHFQQQVRERFAKFGLELAEEKTRRILFGRFADITCRRHGLGRPETFEFLGFKHVCGVDRAGRFALIRIPSVKSCRKFLARTREWILQHRHWRRWEQQQHLTTEAGSAGVRPA